ncbi:SH2 domain-containing protein 4A-like [Haliotis rufescens]|uniref:SH2 domain-containing protein 4A-like n=1 Tax=Haliotis rufescens TaxID=6454 RepID=UPI001EAFAF48|nr:SH2 domain-containing protein 4A-like [Haliotis rufescens]
MLQQILRDMYIEPELLAELSEDQKQYLFVKMREEQVRRWKEKVKEFEERENNQPTKPSKPGRKKVEFLQGQDGQEWVWVMGDHANDKPIQQLLDEEAQVKALQQAEKEAQEMRKKEEENWKRQLEDEKKKLEKQKEETELLIRRKQQEAELYQSLKESQQLAQKLQDEKKLQEIKKLEELKAVTERERRKSVEKYDNMRHRRSSEIYIRWKEMRNALERTAEESSQEVEASWQKQEKKSKEAEQKMRELARKAREEYKESMKRTNQLIQAARAFSDRGKAGSHTERPPVPPKKHLTNRSSIKRWTNRPSRPPGRAAVVAWFQLEERPRGAGLDRDNKIATWFHGIITRLDCERQLRDRPIGSFLVRVSERVWGYTISYRGEDRVKHFLVDTTDGGYQFLGASQIQHSSLADLIGFHRDNAITISGGEKLLYECGQTVEPPDYSELLLLSESTSL